MLTSSKTLSAAEEFCYNLQSLKRATVVGERTGGGAHMGKFFRLDDHFEAYISVARSVNPVTGSNWEGSGVSPDIEVPADQALNVAYAEALRAIIARAEKETLAPWRRLQQEAEKALSELE